MADRYKMLPSEVLARATTLDLYIMDAALSYHNHQSKLASGQQPDYEADDLLAAMAQTKRHKSQLTGK
jgi:hypothetical protein